VRKNAAPPSPGDGDDAAGRVVAGGGEVRTSSETGTTRLAATSPVEARKRALGGRVLFLGFRRCTRSLEGRSAGRNLAGDGDDAACRGVTGGGEEKILGFRVPAAEEEGAAGVRRRRREELATGKGEASCRGRKAVGGSQLSRRRTQGRRSHD
jgi:hypothetical protein